MGRRDGTGSHVQAGTGEGGRGQAAGEWLRLGKEWIGSTGAHGYGGDCRGSSGGASPGWAWMGMAVWQPGIGKAWLGWEGPGSPGVARRGLVEEGMAAEVRLGTAWRVVARNGVVGQSW